MIVNILIVEDEALLAQRIERFLKESKQFQTGRVTVKSNLSSAKDFLILFLLTQIKPLKHLNMVYWIL